MIIRDLESVTAVEWGNGLSRRLLLAADGMGYSVTDTLVRAGTTSPLEYRNHFEACYCVGGSGEVIESDGTSHRLTPGTLYALDEHDLHHLVAAPHEDLRLVCVFAPPLRGDEAHRFGEGAPSSY
ncbi:ectoine synthase [Streptomyces sp. NBC_01187]|uniref:ectoine synthase n=1 Tax=Streptomyces sp. NBC_01187 TaxID=2903766 RepID=UPI00386851DD|nr:ectoine synthase [Streptomyces sp. NBC_01187]